MSGTCVEGWQFDCVICKPYDPETGRLAHHNLDKGVNIGIRKIVLLS